MFRLLKLSPYVHVNNANAIMSIAICINLVCVSFSEYDVSEYYRRRFFSRLGAELNIIAVYLWNRYA